MPGKTVTLTGWKAALALVVLVGVVGFRVATARAKLDTQGRAALEAWVQGEMIRPILADTTRSLAERGAAIVDGDDTGGRNERARSPGRRSTA